MTNAVIACFMISAFAGKQNSVQSFLEMMSVLLIFVAVLGATIFTTRWIAGFQKQQGMNGNIELLDAVRLNGNKYIQLVRIGETYVAVAVCKDTVTTLAQIPAREIKRLEEKENSGGFSEILARIRKQGDCQEPIPSEDNMEETERSSSKDNAE